MGEITIIPLVFRGTERIFIIASSVLCIFLGYKLFKDVPSHNESKGKFTLKEYRKRSSG